ncbi:MAG: hypothetical protein ACRC57_04560 [Sarcina sp.]
MTSYNEQFCENKIKEYKKIIKSEKFRNLEIIYKEVEKVTDGYIYKRRKMLKEGPIELRDCGKLICEISIREIQGSSQAIKRAKGKCGVLGLGLGYYVQEIAKKEDVKEIIVYEINQDIIDLYIKNFGENKKIKIICEDGFKAAKDKFDFFFADIYSYELTTKVAIDYGKLIDLHDIYEYSFFGVEKFLLSCPLEELLMVYIPDEWMDMTRATFDRVDSLGQVNNIRKLRRTKAKEILDEFKKILI